MSIEDKSKLKLFQKSFLNPFAFSLKVAQLNMILLVLSVTLNVILGCTVFIQAQKDPTYLNVTGNKIQQLERDRDFRVTDYTNYKMFITDFLDSVYDLDQDTLDYKLSIGSNMVESSVWDKFYSQLVEKGRLDDIKNGNLKTNIKIMELSNLTQESKLIFNVSALVIYTQENANIKKNSNIMMTINLKLLRVHATPSNIWGFQVIGLDEIDPHDLKGGQ